MSSIPEAFHVAILLRVAVKSTFVCKCVCKKWYQIISNPSFAKNHLNLSAQRNNARLVIESENGYRLYSASCDSLLQSLNKTDDAVAVDMEFPYKSLNREINVWGTCNGLIYGWNDKLHLFFLWNPATKEYKILPASQDTYYGCDGAHGFGYDCKTDDYKLVSVTLNLDGRLQKVGNYAVQVYSLKSNSWKRLQPINRYGLKFNKSGVLFNGALYWLATEAMVSFNISEERFGEMQLPMGLRPRGRQMLGLLKGCLCLSGRKEEKKLEVWAMQDDGVSQSWTKLHIIRPFQIASMNFIGLLKNSESPFKDRMTKTVFLYDLKHETDGKTRLCGFTVLGAAVNYYGNLAGAVKYYESLVSLNSITTVESSKKRKTTQKSEKKKTKKRKR